jgi:hypothetical protein
MNKYINNSLVILFIVMLSLMLFKSWLDLDFGLGQFILIAAGGYGIYLNLKARIFAKNHQP